MLDVLLVLGLFDLSESDLALRGKNITLLKMIAIDLFSLVCGITEGITWCSQSDRALTAMPLTFNWGG